MGKKYLLTAEQIDEIYDEGRSHWDGWFKDCTVFDWCGEMLEKCEHDERTCNRVFKGTNRGFKPRYFCSKCDYELQDDWACCPACCAKVVE